MLSDDQIKNIVLSEASGAISYIGDSDLSKNRETLMDYYNQKPYGDEQDGQSKVVTSDVADVVETMLPMLMRLFTQGSVIGKFNPTITGTEEEADQKTRLVNYEFLERNNGVLLLHNMMKDALLQYTGVLKAYWCDKPITENRKYEGLSELEYRYLSTDDSISIEKVEENETPLGITYNVEVEKTTSKGRLKYVGIPPEEFLINDDARDFKTPRFIGQRSPKTRSDLIQMGFSKDIVNNLPADDPVNDTGEKQARYEAVETTGGYSNHSPNDLIYLGEYYMQIDVNEDGVTECWKVFIAGNDMLGKERVDDHPFCCMTPIPIPHRAIGTCPAEQVADLQYWKSTLVRQMNNNIYQVNYSRTLANERVNYDDLLNPVAGGVIRIEDTGSVGDAVQPFVTQPQVQPILQGIEYVDSSREVRTGVTRYSQGLDGDALNQTATGFAGIRQMAESRTAMTANIFASTGIKEIFQKGIKILSQYQDTAMQIRVSGAPMEIDPSAWEYNLDCTVEVGASQAEQMQVVSNLNYVLEKQLQFIQMGIPVTDYTKLYNTLDRVTVEAGLRDSSMYWNNPSKPEQLTDAENMILKQQLAVLQQQLDNPLAEAEKVKAQAKLQETVIKEQTDMEKFQQEQAFEQEKFIQEEATKRTELELKYNEDIPGSAV